MRGRRLLEGGLRVRRGRRRDLDGLRGLLAWRADERSERFDRRTLADPSQDVYVAEAPGGEIVGVVSLAYVRSLRTGGYAAVLDAARAAPAPGRALLDALLEIAEERARRRGCRQVHAWIGADDGALRAALASRGWQMEESLGGVVHTAS